MSKKLKKLEKSGKDMRSSLDAQLLAYCAMAGGALLAAQPADAAIVYSGVKNQVLTDNNTIVLDLDSNGAADFKLQNVNGKAVSFISYTGTCTFTTSTFGTFTYTAPCRLTKDFAKKKFTKNIVAGAQPKNVIAAQGVSADPAKIRLGLGNVIPGEAIGWIDGNAELSFSSLSFSYNNGGTTNKAVGGPLFSRKGYLGVKFQIDNATHYGWIQYQGDNGTQNVDNATSLKATVVDWAYEKLPDTPISIGQDISNCAALSPSRISRVASFFKPFSTILIKGDGSTVFTKDTAIDWGTGGVTTLFKVPLGKSTMLAVVRIKPSLIKRGDTYEVTVGDCAADLTVGF